MRSKTSTWKDGDEGWEVEWCKHMPHYEDDPETCDPDNAVMVTRDFRDRDAAYAYAREVYPRSVTGIVQVTPFVLERLCEDDPFCIPWNCHKEYTADSDFFEGE
jgi:hypothetical protein